MFRSVHIQRVLACYLLVVFALSITPKRYLHNAFARHVDGNNRKDSHTPYQFNTAGFNCDNDNLVAESSFENGQSVFQFPLFSSFASYLEKPIFFPTVEQLYSRLRGPPVNS